MNDLELKRKRIESVVKIIATGVIGFLAASYVVLAIKGIIGLAVIAVLSLFLINVAAPWFAAKVANWRLKALKHEASLNPIETLENQYQEREKAMLAFKENIRMFYAEVQNFYAEMEKFKSEFPGQPCAFEAQYAKMNQLLAARTNKYKQAQQKLAEFDELIDRKRSEWRVAQAAARMSKAAGVGEDFISKLMADTALDSIQTNLNLAFSDLETSLLDEVSITSSATPVVHVPTAIPEQTGPPTLDLDFEEVAVAVERK